MRMQTRKPEPAVGQVWLLDNPSGRWAGALERIEFDDDMVCFAGFAGNARSALSALRGGNWRCIGIETRAGRVMVGEQREPLPDLVYVVDHVVDGEHVWVQDGGEGQMLPASKVARWPLASAAKDAPLDIMRMAKDAAKDAAWDSVSFGGIDAPNMTLVAEPVYAGGQLVGKTRGVCKVGVTIGWKDMAEYLGIKMADPTRGCADVREDGPGIARLPVTRPAVAPEVVHTWEAWALP